MTSLFLSLTTCVLVNSEPHFPTPIKQEYAFTTIYSEIHHDDFEYFLAVRTLFRSLKESGNTKGEYVVLVHADLSDAYRDAFSSDGLTLIQVDGIRPPEHFHTPYRFRDTMDKLHLWNLVQYRKVIYFDADCIVLKNIDFLFECGDFCAVYHNPVRFSTSLMVIKPSITQYQQLFDRLETLEPVDGSDNGVLNALFPEMINANLFNRTETAELLKLGQVLPKEHLMRIPVQHHMTHVYFYEKFSWEGVWGGEENMLSITFPFPPSLKPWKWWTQPFLEMSLLWHSYRVMADESRFYWFHMLLLTLLIPFAFGFRRVLPIIRLQIALAMDNYLAPADRWVAGLLGNVSNATTKLVLTRGSLVIVGWICSALATIAAVVIVPGWVRWELAWPCAVISHFHILALLLSVVQAFVWRAKGLATAGGMRTLHYVLYFLPVLLWHFCMGPYFHTFSIFTYKLLFLFVIVYAVLGLHSLFLHEFIYNPSRCDGGEHKPPI